MKAQLPRYWPAQMAYHHAREDLYRRIIFDCRLPPAALILDAPCGDAFYSDLLASVVGPRVRVVAADFNLATLRSRPLSSAGVLRCLTDVEQAGLRRRSFDVVWTCRSMHSATDPQRRVTALAALLRPGGRLIVVENDPFHCSIPAWTTEFERRVQRAVDRLLRQRCGNGTSIDRYSAPRHSPVWLARAGLRQITARTYPVEDSVPLADEAERYWQLWMRQRGEMVRPFLSDADRRTYARAFDPEGHDYVLKQPGMSCLDPTTVVCGVAE